MQQSCFHVVTGIAAVLLFANTVFAESLDPEIAATLRTHCLKCHGPEKAEARLRVDDLTADLAERGNALNWIEIRNAINLGEMPPEGEKPLPVEMIRKMSSWITQELRAAERSRTSSGGRVLLRRMNRHEYTNTVADLLSMRFPTGESPLDVLPPDGTAEGFDKISFALLVDPSLMTQYYQVARRIADRAIVDGPPEHPTEKMRLEFEDIPASGAIGYLIERLGMNPVPGGLQLIEGSTRSFAMLRYPGRRDNNVAPVNGFYRFTIRAGAARGADGTVPRLLLRHSHPDADMQSVMEFSVTAPWDEPAEYSVTIPRDTLGNELSVRMLNEVSLYMGQRPGENFMRRNAELGKAGKFTETLRLDGRKVAEGWGGDRSTPDPEKLDVTKYPRVFLDYLEVEGHDSEVIIGTLKAGSKKFNGEVIEAITQLQQKSKTRYVVNELHLDDLRVGMRLAEDLSLDTAMLVAPKGTDITKHFLQVLHNYDSCYDRSPFPKLIKVFVREPDNGRVKSEG